MTTRSPVKINTLFLKESMTATLSETKREIFDGCKDVCK